MIEEQLENDMQMAYSVYNTINQQKVLAEAKLRERTPAFTTLQSASVPVKHAGTKRMITVAALTLLSFFLTAIILLYRSISQKEEDGEGEGDNYNDEEVEMIIEKED
jgi:LPS O-antigen subunit length determinant protein (WzzB/FepE family)